MGIGMLKQYVQNLKGGCKLYIHPLLFLLICAMCSSVGAMVTALLEYLFDDRRK